MEINYDVINNIFSSKLNLKNNKDKIKLSEYDKYIPMFDIYSKKIYPILNKNIHYRMIDCHYRFINKELIDWMKNIVQKKKENYKIVENNLKILSNYDIDILYETSLKTFFKYSPKFGLMISICKRNSFHPRMIHISPYYSKQELIKLGKNMNLIKEDEDYDLMDQKTHYDICKNISKNDISFELLYLHSNQIVKDEILNLINYYSLNGSFLMNKLLRNFSTDSKYFNKNIIKNIIELNDTIVNSPELNNDFYFYRFIWDDGFLMNLNIGEVFTDNGFLSTTRDPFYSPGTDYNFGLVLLKINIPKNIKGVGLFIENFSLFPIEEEFLLPPGTILKLISKNDHFKYHHINPKFERLVKKKYEFIWEGRDNKIIDKIAKYSNFKIEYPIITDKEFVLEGDDLMSRMEFFIKHHTKNFYFYYKNYLMNVQWFDGTSSYQDFYYNKISKGLIITLTIDNNLITTIECGDVMIINYLLSKYYNNNKTKKIYEIYHYFGKIFGYKEFLIFDTFKTFEKKNDTEDIFRLNKKYNYDLYNYLKNGKFDEYKYGKRIFGNLKNKLIFNKIDKELSKKYMKNETTNLKDLIINMIENNYFYYQKIENYIIEKNSLDIYITQINNQQYWHDLNIDFTIYQDFISKEEEFNTSFNRRRVR